MKHFMSRNLVSKNLILLCLISITNSATARKLTFHKKISAESQKQTRAPITRTTANDVVTKNELEPVIIQAITDEFTARKVIGEIPNALIPEFNAKKQVLIDNFTKKMDASKTFFIKGSDITNQVQQTFKIFINRVKFYHIHEWTKIVVANLKKNKVKGKNSSSINVDSSLKTFANNPPYLNKDGSLEL